MSSARCPVIPYEKQEDPRSNRMCGAACLAMVYRSLAERQEGEVPRKRGRDRRSGSPVVTRAKERRAGRRRAEELTQAEIFAQISKPTPSGGRSSATHLMVSHARSKGFAALAVQARYPLVALLACRDSGIRTILNHRLRPDGAAGHYTVLLEVDTANVVVHDPLYGPRRHVPHAELLELWQPRFAGSEIAGNVLIGIVSRPAAVPQCPICETPIPPEVSCPRCGKAVALAPAELLGCVGKDSCLGRLWNYLCCPACDEMWSFELAPAAAAPAPVAEDGPWNLGPLFTELEKFRQRVLSIPAAASNPEIRQQLELLERSKLELKLQEQEEATLVKEREIRMAEMGKSYGEEAAAVEKAREEAARPAAPADGAALGDALLKELGITAR